MVRRIDTVQAGLNQSGFTNFGLSAMRKATEDAVNGKRKCHAINNPTMRIWVIFACHEKHLVTFIDSTESGLQSHDQNFNSCRRSNRTPGSEPKSGKAQRRNHMTYPTAGSQLTFPEYVCLWLHNPLIGCCQ